MKKLLALLIVLSLSASLGLAIDGGPPEGRGPMHNTEKRMENLSKKLELTKDQEKQVLAHFESRKKTMKKDMEKIKSLRDALNKEIAKDSPSQTKIKKLSSEMKTMRGGHFDEMVSGRLEMKKILTKEQFSKLEKMQSRKGPGRHDRKEKKKGWFNRGNSKK
jgi:Spy/CpxP family protein refolding chaperone